MLLAQPLCYYYPAIDSGEVLTHGEAICKVLERAGAAPSFGPPRLTLSRYETESYRT